MDSDSKWMIGYIWLLTLMGAVFWGHELGIMKGEHETRIAMKHQLESCQKVIAGVSE